MRDEQDYKTYCFLRKVAPTCKCGCGNPTTRSKVSPYHWNEYINGHNSGRDKHYELAEGRMEKRRSNMETKPQQPCDCGCGDLAMPGNRYIDGHQGDAAGKKGKTWEQISGIKKSKDRRIRFNYSMKESWKVRKKNGYVHSSKGKTVEEIGHDVKTCNCYICKAKRGEAYNKGLRGRKLEDIIGKEKAKLANEKRGISISRWHKNPNNAKEKEQWLINSFSSHQIKPNKPEKKIIKLLNQWYPGEFIYTGGGLTFYPISHKFPDFVNIYYPIIVEHFGTHWHKLEDESLRTERFRKCGYETIVIWENNFNDPNGELLLKNKIDYVRDKIKI